ncbi:MAG TPA: amino acid ABC transporter ATP-binding protein [candidate division Zixibacteria bacterium]|jgi:polar amino acid transport system ATP-binding protein
MSTQRPHQSAIVIARGLRKRFGQLIALDGVDLTVGHCEVVVLVGPSGGGKSTLLRCLNGLERPDSGTIEISGNSVNARSADINALRAKTGMVFQQFNLFPHLTALENVALAPRVVLKLSKTDAQVRARENLDHVGLGEKLHSHPAELSGGQQQRVAIARALAMGPSVMLFDEPTSALDSEMIGEVLSVMRRLAEDGMTMVIVSHELGFVREIAHRVAFLEGGRIIASGSPQEMLVAPTHERIRKFIENVVR